MLFSIEDLDSDNSSIQDVLLCWRAFGEEDNECNLLNLMQKKLDIDFIPTDVIPPSPERVTSSLHLPKGLSLPFTFLGKLRLWTV
jgi:hypothetical protein